MKVRLQAIKPVMVNTSKGIERLGAGGVVSLPYKNVDVLLKTGKFMLLPWHFIQKSSESVSTWLEKLSDAEKEIYRDRIKYMKFDGGLSTDEFKIESIKGIIKQRIIEGKCDSCVLAPLEKSHRRRANNGGSGFHRYQCMSI